MMASCWVVGRVGCWVTGGVVSYCCLVGGVVGVWCMCLIGGVAWMGSGFFSLKRKLSTVTY